MQRARAALLGAVSAVGLEAEQLQDGGQGDHGAGGVEVDGRAGRGHGLRLLALVLSLALLLAVVAGRGQFAVTSGMDLLVAAVELVLGCDVADGAVQAHGVVMGDVLRHDPPRVVERQRHEDTDTLALDGLVPAFDLAVGSKPSIAPDLDGACRTFRVTHPFHPLCGREFTLVTYRHNWGENRVYFYNDEGRLVSLPASWTSVFPPDPLVVLAAGRSAFRVTDLLELAQLLNRLRQEVSP